MTYTRLTLATEGAVGVITLSDPATLNAASLEMAGELREALGALTSGPKAVRALVLTGAGRGFCSGANLSAGSGPGGGAVDGDGLPDAGRALEHTYNPLMITLRDLPIPLVTAVNGAAAGIGCSLALMGDLIVAARSAYFLQAFRRIGLVPDGGSTYLLSRMIGKARAMEMMLLGDKVSAETALSWGLVNRVTEDQDLMACALELAGRLSEGPASLGLIRKAAWSGLDASFADQLHAERTAQRTAGKTEDFSEGVRAFLEKRPAAFRGR